MGRFNEKVAHFSRPFGPTTWLARLPKKASGDWIHHGALKYHPGNGKIALDRHFVSAGSVLNGELQLAQLKACRQFARGRLLDVGCGHKPYETLFKDFCQSHIGIDARYSEERKGRMDAVAMADQLPFAAESFDTVLCTEVLEHVPDPKLVLDELVRVVRPGGRVILTVPFLYQIHEEPYDYWRFTVFGLRNLLRSRGLEVKYIGLRGGPMEVIADSMSKFMLAKFAKLRTKRPRWIAGMLWASLAKFFVFIPQSLYLGIVRPNLRILTASGSEDTSHSMTLGYVIVADRESKL